MISGSTNDREKESLASSQKPLFSIGLQDLACPVTVQLQDGSTQQTIATYTVQAIVQSPDQENALAEVVQLVSFPRKDCAQAHFPILLQEVQSILVADTVEMTMSFPLFLAKQAPVSATTSLMEYRCSCNGVSGEEGGLENKQSRQSITVVVPVTTLCPCSKEISSFGAHNQRAEVTLTASAQKEQTLCPQELIVMVEQCGSSELYALLKRPDEKYVTELAYKNPMFVEDVVRKVAQKSMEHPAIAWFSVGVESFESIHNHSAYAYVDSNDLY